VYSSAGLVPLPSHLTSCTPTKSNLYLDSSFKTVTREPALHILHTLHVRNLMFIFCLRSFIQRTRPSPRVTDIFHNKLTFYSEGLLVPRPTPKLDDHPLSFVHGCLFSIFATTLHSRRGSLHPQSEDTPCCGDKETHLIWIS
jgi:hypothetical protein